MHGLFRQLICAERLNKTDVRRSKRCSDSAGDLHKKGKFMLTNLDRYKKDLDILMSNADMLLMSLQHYCYADEFEKEVKKNLGKKAKEYIAALPDFKEAYQAWYSEAKSLIRQLLPDRLSDFVRYYEKPKPRKDIDFENYRIEDCLQGLTVTQSYPKEIIVDTSAAIPHFKQQIAIIRSVKARFESSLFDIKQLVQSDLFDSELDAARELLRHKFTRAAGAIAGVVLERHLSQVCDNHGLKVSKKSPGISDLNEIIKEACVIDVPQWRFIQHLSDIRNLCDHSKKVDPTLEQVTDLVNGVAKVTKTVF